MADYSPVYTGGVKPFTKTTSSAVTGGQILDVSGVGTVAPSGAASVVVCGVAAHDAASGARVTVWPLINCEHEIVATGTVTAAAGVVTGAAGVAAGSAVGAAQTAGTLIGIATSTASGPNKVRFIGRG